MHGMSPPVTMTYVFNEITQQDVYTIRHKPVSSALIKARGNSLAEAFREFCQLYDMFNDTAPKETKNMISFELDEEELRIIKCDQRHSNTVTSHYVLSGN